ncbi:MAG: hypothetical protein Q8M24_22415 [Pseudolabrys sp.]|nr:hypothetical protein [Pseudolabrys sp.]
MSNNTENRSRALAEVVAIDAWHDAFDQNISKVDLYVDVEFETGRIGGEAESSVRFRLNISQADLVVVIPDSEPLGIEKRSVSRDSPPMMSTISNEIELSADATMSIARIGEADKLDYPFFVTQSKTSDGHYRWILRPSQGQVLQGRPWNPDAMPRMKIFDKRKNRRRGIPPVARVEVRCRREDIKISDIEWKDNSLWEIAKSRAGFRNKLAAAEAYIRDRLAKENLPQNNFNDSFGDITLASVIAEPQGADR